MDESEAVLHSIFGDAFVVESRRSGALERLRLYLAQDGVHAVVVLSPKPRVIDVVDTRLSPFPRSMLANIAAAGTVSLHQAHNESDFSGALYSSFTAMLDALEGATQTKQAPVAAEGPKRAMLLQLDHMRQRGPYVDAIRGFAHDAGLRGCVVFFGRLILIALHGQETGCREYLRLHRTNTVDVDSAGRRCREKMLDVLFEGPPAGHDGTSRVAEGSPFQAADCASAADAVRTLHTRGCVPLSALEQLAPLAAAVAEVRYSLPRRVSGAAPSDGSCSR